MYLSLIILPMFLLAPILPTWGHSRYLCQVVFRPTPQGRQVEENLISHIARNPDQFEEFEPNLFVSKGDYYDHELASAYMILPALAHGETLVLTPSLYGFRWVPAFDGVIFSRSGQAISNISIKSSNIRKVSLDSLIKNFQITRSRAQRQLRKQSQLANFVEPLGFRIEGDDLEPIRKQSIYSQQKKERAKSILDFFGLDLGGNFRKTTLVLTITFPLNDQFVFEAKVNYQENLGYGKRKRDYMLVVRSNRTGRRKNLLNLSQLKRNLIFDKDIQGYIFASPNQVVTISSQGFEIIDVQ